jgi:hypothetical protein
MVSARSRWSTLKRVLFALTVFETLNLAFNQYAGCGDRFGHGLATEDGACEMILYGYDWMLWGLVISVVELAILALAFRSAQLTWLRSACAAVTGQIVYAMIFMTIHKSLL